VIWGRVWVKLAECKVLIPAGPPGTHILRTPLSFEVSLPWGVSAFWILNHHHPP
jgi:hypothetical protein